MWISRRTDYATRALLARRSRAGGPMKLEELACRTSAPQSVLEQVMPTMRTAGIVRSSAAPRAATGSTRRPTRSRSSASSASSRASWRRSATRPAAIRTAAPSSSPTHRGDLGEVRDATIGLRGHDLRRPGEARRGHVAGRLLGSRRLSAGLGSASRVETTNLGEQRSTPPATRIAGTSTS